MEEMLEGMETLIAGMFTLDWNLKFPGEFMESNSDSLEGNGATWHVNLKTMYERGEQGVVIS